jgi:hypothetical protein
MRIIPAALLALTLGIPAAASVASAQSVLGSWSGRGSVTLIPSGQVEPVSCRVSYEKGDDRGRTFVLNATCATTAGTFAQSGRVVKLKSGRYSGSLYSDQYAVSGKVTVTVRGSSQTVSVSSSKGKGLLKLTKR